MENSPFLENMVLLGTPQEVAADCKLLRKDENSCRALGLACRFRGLEYVKALVENGANFRYIRPEGQGGYFSIYYWLAPLEMNQTLRSAYFINSDPCFSSVIQLTNVKGAAVKTLKALPIEERAKIVKYLCENSERVQLDPGELLFYSIMSNSKKITAVLKEYGAKFSEKRTTMLTESGRSFEWQEFCNMADNIGDDEYLEIMRNIIAEIDGKKLHYTESIYWGNYNAYRNQFRLYKPEIFRFILENFDQKKMNKTQLMKGAIAENSVECLSLCAENGWLKMPRKRDEMIEFATKNQKTECAAWLLDFKNRTADLAAERAKAEKKAERELNADPNSATELKKIWNFEKREDADTMSAQDRQKAAGCRQQSDLGGTIIITRYKGKRTEIEVPAKIGKNAVTAIGEYAFSPDASRITIDQRTFRRTITKVKLPDSIQIVGKGAFCNCWGMSELNIPENVAEIGDNALCGCRGVTEFVIPESVNKLGQGMFVGCTALRSVRLPENTAEIGDYMFSNCTALEKITIPSAVVRIGKWAFNRCGSLEEIVIPEGVEEIDKQAFMNCSSLKTVVLPASIRSIKNYKYRNQAPETVFHDSPNVTAVVEPKSYAEKYCQRNGINFVYKESL